MAEQCDTCDAGFYCSYATSELPAGNIQFKFAFYEAMFSFHTYSNRSRNRLVLLLVDCTEVVYGLRACVRACVCVCAGCQTAAPSRALQVLTSVIAVVCCLGGLQPGGKQFSYLNTEEVPANKKASCS